MTANPDDLSIITMGEYSVGAAATDTITIDAFDKFLEWAEADATADKIVSTQYDRAVIYLIADSIYRGSPGADKASRKIGSTSYTKFDDQSQWIKAYNNIKASSKASTMSNTVPYTVVERTDNPVIAFDSNPVRTFYG